MNEELNGILHVTYQIIIVVVAFIAAIRIYQGGKGSDQERETSKKKEMDE